MNLDPARANDIESLEVAEQVYGRLVRFAPGRLEPEPDLATSWSVSADGTVWTFELRPDVTFHDGTPFDADAVVFSFERQLLADHPAHEPDFVWSRAFHNIRRVTARGRLRVQFEIDRPYAPFLANLAMGPAAIVSPTAVKRLGSKFGSHPVGTGPYRFVEWIPGDRITLERNLQYWDRPPRIRYLVLLTLPDSRERLQALESGAADVIQQLAPDDLPLVQPAPGSAARDGAGGAGLVPGAEHPAAAAERSAHPARDRPRHPSRRAGQAGLSGAGHPGDRAAAAQRLGRALRRRHLSLRPDARAPTAGRGRLARHRARRR